MTLEDIIADARQAADAHTYALLRAGFDAEPREIAMAAHLRARLPEVIAALGGKQYATWVRNHHSPRCNHSGEVWCNVDHDEVLPLYAFPEDPG